jgi:hypothetical protein
LLFVVKKHFCFVPWTEVIVTALESVIGAIAVVTVSTSPPLVVYIPKVTGPTLVYLQYADKGIGQSGSTTVNAKRVNLNVVGKSGATTVVASFRTDDKDNFCTSNVNSNANMCCASNMLCTLDISNSTSISISNRSNRTLSLHH